MSHRHSTGKFTWRQDTNHNCPLCSCIIYFHFLGHMHLKQDPLWHWVKAFVDIKEKMLLIYLRFTFHFLSMMDALKIFFFPPVLSVSQINANEVLIFICVLETGWGKGEWCLEAHLAVYPQVLVTHLLPQRWQLLLLPLSRTQRRQQPLPWHEQTYL